MFGNGTFLKFAYFGASQRDNGFSDSLESKMVGTETTKCAAVRSEGGSASGVTPSAPSPPLPTPQALTPLSPPLTPTLRSGGGPGGCLFPPTQHTLPHPRLSTTRTQDTVSVPRQNCAYPPPEVYIRINTYTCACTCATVVNVSVRSAVPRRRAQDQHGPRLSPCAYNAVPPSIIYRSARSNF